MKRSWLRALIAAGLVLFPVWNTASAPAALRRQKPEAHSHRRKAAARGALDMADGQIKSVGCKGRSLDMVFDADDEILHLHTDNYFRVDFSAINFTPKGVMNPCKQAKGMYARVYFYHIKGQPHKGILTTVEFRE